MSKRYWSKLLPNTQADVLGDPDVNGYAPAYIYQDGVEPLSGAVKLEEWSEVEVVPAPHAVPDAGYLVMYGPDPSDVYYVFHERELDAAVDSARRDNSFGYVPVDIKRYATVPPKKD